MPEKLPVDFEQRVKAAPPAGGKGYPYQISARDLMANFKFLMNQMPEGINKNDTLIFDGKKWIILAAPPSTGTYVPGCVNGKMQWLSTSECT